jgi:cell division septal protein FtsQ
MPLPWAGRIPLNGKTAFNVVVLALLGWALVWLSTSEQFYVRHVEIVGNSQVSGRVLSEVSGIEGYSVFWVNPRQVAAQILESLPPIKAVQVRHGFAGQDGLGGWVTLEVRERGQEIVWQVAGQRYWVDASGELHEVRGLGDEVGQPESESAGPRLLIQDVRASRPASVDLSALVGARQLVHLLPEVRVLEYAPGTGLRLKHPRGWMVYLGTGEDMAKKVGVLRAMEVEFAGEESVQPALIDLRYPDSPYYRLPDEESPGGSGG